MHSSRSNRICGSSRRLFATSRNCPAGTVTVNGSPSPNTSDGAISANLSLILFMVCGFFLFLSVHLAEEMFGLDLTLQLHHTVQQRFRTRRAPRHVHIDRNDLVDPFQHVVRSFERGRRKMAPGAIAITYFGSAIWSYSRLSTGAILCTIVPATTITSAWRGLARVTSNPNRAKS